MDGGAGHEPLDADRVIAAEQTFLTARRDSPDAPPTPDGLSALCLSGGGVRSASFCLGILQGLSQAGTLRSFDYLSTVSGGGYVGGWLTAWRTRAAARGAGDPVEGLSGTERSVVQLPPEGGSHETNAGATHAVGSGGAQGITLPPEGGSAGTRGGSGGTEGGTRGTNPVSSAAPGPVARLRAFIRFLDPRLSAGSADVWTLGTIILRNLLLNWLVLLPLLAAAALVPRLYVGILGLPSQPELISPERLAWWYRHDWIACLLLFGGALTFAARQLPSLGNGRYGQRAFLWCFLFPSILGETILAAHQFWGWRFEGGIGLRTSVAIAALTVPIPWLVGAIGTGRWFRPVTWIAAVAAAASGRAAIWSARHLLVAVARDHPQVFATFEMPITLALLFGQITLFVGLASREMTDEDREWWGRAAAWILMAAVGWLAAGILALYGPILLSRLFSAAGVSELAGRGWLALIGIVVGGAAAHLAAVWPQLGPLRARLARVVVLGTAPALVLLLTLLLATADLRLLDRVHRLGLFHEIVRHPQGASLPEDLIALGLLLTIGLVAGRLVSVNDFSLHSMYRHRLTRTFLGASRSHEDRHPNPFTGFDEADDLPLASAQSAGRPLQVVNATLNTLDCSGPTGQHRADAFTMTALHAGAARIGYRPTAEYDGGLTLGEALTISGAAVSPNMGASSKPALTFLLTLLNARLGVWLANPGPAGRHLWRTPNRAFGARPLLDELLGRTRDESPYVYLSDGGHFENLGLYEMIRRRCRYIVVVDAGCDPEYRFDDLANAIRQIRLDFGVEIDFPGGLGITAAGGRCAARWALGQVRYSAANPGTPDGVVLFLKAAVCGDEPVDVLNYAAAHPSFPQQTTANQWFDPAQFESYRQLGMHTVSDVAGHAQIASVVELCARAAELHASRAASRRTAAPATMGVS